MSLDPKKASGDQKPQLQLLPAVFEEQTAAALKIGAEKYGPWNWRGNQVEIMTYLGAMRRHIAAVLDGEDIDPESGAHHLGHVAASCAIVLDARKHGTLADNRPQRRACAGCQPDYWRHGIPQEFTHCPLCGRVMALEQKLETEYGLSGELVDPADLKTGDWYLWRRSQAREIEGPFIVRDTDQPKYWSRESEYRRCEPPKTKQP